jgi:hypothetical protein
MLLKRAERREFQHTYRSGCELASMSQTELEQKPEVVAEQQQVQTATTTLEPAVPREFKQALVVVTVAVLLVLSAAAITRATWAFVPVYLGAVISYIAGSVYLIRRLINYDGPQYHRRRPPA